METYGRAGTVIFVSNGSPEATIAQDIEARGLVVLWARSIKAAVDLLNSAREKTVIVTELALADGNWRDLVERMRGIDICVPIYSRLLPVPRNSGGTRSNAASITSCQGISWLLACASSWKFKVHHEKYRA